MAIWYVDSRSHPARLFISTNVARPQSSKQPHTCDIEWNFASVVYEQMAVTPNAF